MCLECEVTEEMPAEPLGHDEVTHEAVAATCTEKGNEEYVTCSRCDHTTLKEIDALGHDEVKHKAVAATCTEKGNEGYVTCSRCDYTTYKEIPAKGHKEVLIPGKAATCVRPGKTEGSYCWVCNVTLKYQETVPATGKHIPIVVKGVAPTCTRTGRTDVIRCDGCNSILVRSENIDPTGHSLKTVYGKPATCTESGLSDGVACETCGHVEVEQKTLQPGHICKQGICTVCGVKDYMEPTQYISDYCYRLIGTFENGDRMQVLYKRLAEVAREFHINYSLDLVSDPGRKIASLTRVEFTDLNLTKDEAFTALCALKMDAPIYYWLSTYSVAGGADIDGRDYATLWVASFYLNGKVREEYSRQIAATVENIVSEANDDASIYEKTLYYYDWILDNVEYEYAALDDMNAHYWVNTPIGPLVKKMAVCGGYVDGLSILLNFSGIENRDVVGKVDGIGHKWMVVKLDDGNWYWFDPTFDDYNPRNGIYQYRYFAINDKQTVDWCDVNIAWPKGSLGKEGILNTHKMHSISDTSYVSLARGVGMVERSATEFSSDSILELRETFTVDGLTYALVGYRKVQLVRSEVSGNMLMIPERVSYNGVEYTVIGVCAMTHDGLFDNTAAITDVEYKTVAVPRTVRYFSASAISTRYTVKVFYGGTEAEWDNVYMDGKSLKNIILYHYSEERPAASGNYWHYVNGVATPW